MHHGGRSDAESPEPLTMRRWRCLPAIALGLSAFLSADGARSDVATPTSVRVGGNLYYGLSNINGSVRRHTDGQWAGVGTAYPSVLSLTWMGADLDTAVGSFGVGDLNTGSGRTAQQPVECYYRRPIGSATVTFGKHYVPFALQEWEYETRWGMMAETIVLGTSMEVSITSNPHTDALNTSIRAAWHVAAGSEVGISAAAGRGWSYGTSHNWGYGIDATVDVGPVSVTTEALEARGTHGTYQFGFIKAVLHSHHRATPYVALFYGHDSADEIAELRSGIVGVDIEALPHLTVSPCIGRAGGRNIWSLQTRVAF